MEGRTLCLAATQAGAGRGVAHLLQVGERDRLAGQHLVRLAGEGRQRRQLLPMGQAAAQHSQAGAGRGGGGGTGSQATVGPASPGKLHFLRPEK